MHHIWAPGFPSHPALHPVLSSPGEGCSCRQRGGGAAGAPARKEPGAGLAAQPLMQREEVCRGRGRRSWMARLPFSGVRHCEYTEETNCTVHQQRQKHTPKADQ